MRWAGVLVVNRSACPWEQEGAVDEGLIVHVEAALDLPLGLLNGAFREGVVAAAGIDLQVENVALLRPRIPLEYLRTTR